MANSNSQNEKISEKEKIYFALRDEVRDNQRQENTMIIFAYTVVATLLGFAFKDNKWAAMIAMLFTIPVSYRIGRFRDSIAYLSTYMYKFLEPHLGFTWEIDHRSYREKNPTSKRLLYTVSRCDFIILSLASAASFWKLNGFNMIHNSLFWTLLTLVVQILMLMLIIISTAKYSNVDELKESKLKKWNEIHS